MASKRLFKSIRDRKLCGVCGGIGEYFNIDSTIIRLIWLLLTIPSFGTSIIVYIIAVIVIPDAYIDDASHSSYNNNYNNNYNSNSNGNSKESDANKDFNSHFEK